MPLKLRRGTSSNRTSITPAEGEPIYTTDTKKLYIGDGSTAGGVVVDTTGVLTETRGTSQSPLRVRLGLSTTMR